MEQAFAHYSMPLKYTITTKKIDPEVLNNEARGNSPIEKMLGIFWNIEDDTTTASQSYNLYGSARVKELGSNLVHMTDKQIQEAPLSRLSFLR